MKPMTMEALARACGGRLVQGSGAATVARFAIDSRKLAAGDCFVAILGEERDGHAFVGQAAQSGGAAAIVSHMPEEKLPESFGVILVDDTLAALQRVAAEYRKTLPVRVVGVTGSSGKTSTKELVAAVLRQAGSTRANVGNLNNHLGVPLTLLSLESTDAWAVVEMGTNHPGEIAPLAAMARPEIGVLTGIGTAHIEFFGSSEAIAQEKAELVAALPSEGVAVLPAADPHSETFAARTRARVIWVGDGSEATWRAHTLRMTTTGITFELEGPSGTHPVRLPTHAPIMVNNALLAAAVGEAAGLSIEQIARGLESVTLPSQRMEVLPRGSGWVLNDSYNANAESMQAGLTTLAEFAAPGRKIAALGSMGELGEWGPELHRRVGAAAARARVDLLLAMGPSAKLIQEGAIDAGLSADACRIAADADQGAAVLLPLLREDDCILVKGSRFMKLEKLTAALVAAQAKR